MKKIFDIKYPNRTKNSTQIKLFSYCKNLPYHVALNGLYIFNTDLQYVYYKIHQVNLLSENRQFIVCISCFPIIWYLQKMNMLNS